MKKISITASILTASLIGAALLSIGTLGFSSTAGEMSKLAYTGNLWCVSNWIEEEDASGHSVFLPDPDGRASMDHRLQGKEDWLRLDQVTAESKAEAEKAATRTGLFEPSEKVFLREALDKNNQAFFTSHFNTGATQAGPCIGTGMGDGIIGSWINDAIRKDCFDLPQNSGSCKTNNESISLKSWGSVTLPALGKIVKEDHLVTKEENFTPSSISDNIQNHFQVTAKAIGKNYSHSGGWTPAEGGAIGSGSTSRPPANAEPWVMNMYWSQSPPAGTKMIITNPSNNKTVVAAAGYETGPSGTKWLLGAQEEVLQALGASTNSEVSVGFATDQNLPFGPLNCETTQTSRSNFATIKPRRSDKCPAEAPSAGPGEGADYRSQIAQAFSQLLSLTSGGGDDTTEASDGVVDLNFDPGNAPEGVLRLPAINESKYGLIGKCNRAAAGMALFYRTGKWNMDSVKSASNTFDILAGVGTGVRDVHRAATLDNWKEIKYQVLVKKNPVVLATGFGSHNMHYITITGFVGDTVYFNDGAHFVGSGSRGQVANRSIDINVLSQPENLRHATNGYRYLYAL